MENGLKMQETGSGKSKMAAIKLELLISQLVDKIGTRFQVRNLSFRGTTIQRNYRENFPPNRKWQIICEYFPI